MIRLAPLPQASIDRILNGAARELWPTLWPHVADMLANRNPVATGKLRLADPANDPEGMNALCCDETLHSVLNSRD